LEEALNLSRNLDDKWGVALVLDGLGQLAYRQGDDERALNLGRESLALHRALGYRQGVATSLANLARATLRRGDLTAALELYREGVTLGRDLEVGATVAACLEGLGCVAAGRGHLRQALRLFGAAAAQPAASVGRRLARPGEYDHSLALAKARLGPAVAAAMWQSGMTTPIDLLVAEVLTDAVRDEESAVAKPVPRTGAAAVDRMPLTERERAVLVLIAQGMTNRQIASELGMAVRTVDTHVTRILHKLELQTRAQAAAWAEAQGLGDLVAR
jgi:non-specific serine/threonine protein kinase